MRNAHISKFIDNIHEYVQLFNDIAQFAAAPRMLIVFDIVFVASRAPEPATLREASRALMSLMELDITVAPSPARPISSRFSLIFARTTSFEDLNSRIASFQGRSGR